MLTCAMLVGCLVSCNIVDTQPNAQPDVTEPTNDSDNLQLFESQQTFETHDDLIIDSDNNMECTLDFLAYKFLQRPEYSYSYSLHVKVIGENLYLNDIMYEYVSYVDNVDVVYHEAMIYGVNMFEPEKAPILEQIKSQEHCYLLKTDIETAFGKVIAVYYIDGVCYFVSFEDEVVQRIHFALIEQEK